MYKHLDKIRNTYILEKKDQLGSHENLFVPRGYDSRNSSLHMCSFFVTDHDNVTWIFIHFLKWKKDIFIFDTSIKVYCDIRHFISEKYTISVISDINQIVH